MGKGRTGRALLAVAALAAGLGPWWAARDDASQAFPGFVVEGSMTRGGDAALFLAETINPEAEERKAHSAALAVRPDGSLVAVWYAGSGEGASDVGIWMAKRGIGGRWSAPREIMSRESVAAQLRRHVVSLGNPVLLTGDGGRLGLLFVSIAAGRWSGSSLNLAWSVDGGETWGPVEKLTTNPLANLSTLPRNPPSPLTGGGWAVPVYEEFVGRFPEVLWLWPGGSRYGVTRLAGGMTIFQPSLVPLAPDRAAVFYRDGGGERALGRAESRDAGRRWSAEAKTALPNADSGVCVTRLADGRLLAAFNDSAERRDRRNLRLAVSGDSGRTWRRIATLAEEDGQEFSYPYLLGGQDGVVRMVYSSRRNRIVYAAFNEAWLAEREAAAQMAEEGTP